MANLDFDATQVDPEVGFDALPEGTYQCVITNSETKQTKAGDGSYLKLELTVSDGPLRNRKIWDNLCLKHPNADAVRIARGRLSAICHATGVMKPQDSVDLHGYPMMVKVACKNREDNGEVTNVIKSYKGVSGAPAPSQGVATQQTSAAPKQAPWEPR